MKTQTRQTHELIYTLDTIDNVAQDFVEILPLVSVMTFMGNLGAGKTTLIQAILEKLGVHDTIQSPTFTYLSSYSTPEGYTINHFDLYRLKSLQQFLDAGFEEYLYLPQSWAFIEWPEIIMPLLTKKACHITIEHYGPDRRKLRYTIVDSQN